MNKICERKIVNVFLPMFGCSKVPSHCDSSFEYPKHMFWSGNKKNTF